MVAEVLTSLSNGARFYRGDLHLHTYGGSFDVSDSSATPSAIVQAAKDEGLSIIAIADHNEIKNVRPALEAAEAAEVLVIPAVELSTPEGHLLCYFPTADSLERFFHRIDIADRGETTCRCQTGVFQCLNYAEAEGGFSILAHVDSPGSFESNLPNFTPAKLDIISHRALEGFEVTRADIAVRYDDIDADDGRRNAANERIRRLKLGSSQFLARILNSDAHSLKAVGRNARNEKRITRYKMETPSFEGLRLALQSAETRVRIEEEVPTTVPAVEGIHFRGGFLDNQAINLSANLTCIIGGRGSGKSTAFEGICLLGGAPAEDVTVIDSDVWPDLVTLFYRDETGHTHSLARSKDSPIENLDDPVTGTTTFPLESYRQGATNDISKRVQGDPLTLLTFLDKLTPVEGYIEEEDKVREQLFELAPKVAKAAANVSLIPGYEKELALKSAQVERLRKEKGKAVIKLQQQLEGEKRSRLTIEAALSRLSGAVSADAITEITSEIKDCISDATIQVAASEATKIESETEDYEKTVANKTSELKDTTLAFVKKARAEVSTWKAKEGQTSAKIEQKKQELLQAGIRLDMLSIQKLVADEARAKENLRQAKGWKPELTRLRSEYTGLLKKRWQARDRVSAIRKAFASRASSALQRTLSDLTVSLKYDESALAPEAERLIIETMGWKTLQQLKGAALIGDLTLPEVLKCVRANDKAPIEALKNSETGSRVFKAGEADVLIERLSDPDILAQLDSAAVYDRPRLSVTKRMEVDGKEKFVPRDFKRLSLGQQQSVLLALMLSSETNAPLIVDQPEDNLDSEFIYKTLVPAIRTAKERRQVIVVTHNANIAVLGDAELIVALKATNERASIVTRGSIDHGETCRSACAILEGSKEAFDRRAQIYGLAHDI